VVRGEEEAIVGSLRDQLVRSGLVSQEQARAAEAAKTTRREGRSQSTPAVAGTTAGRLPAGARAWVPLPAPDQPADPLQEARDSAIASDHRLPGRVRGNRRWYFAGRDRRLPCLELNEEAMGLVERGDAGIVETPEGEAWLVDRDGAELLARAGSTWLRAWRGRTEPS